MSDSRPTNTAPGGAPSHGSAGSDHGLALVRHILSADLPTAAPHECPYLSGRTAREQMFVADQLDGEAYHDLMNAGFRRSGQLFYRPQCPSCSACQALRLPVAAFRPSRSQRRTARRNADVRIAVGPPMLDAARQHLYQQYLNTQHPGTPQSGDWDELEEFLYRSPVTTLEVTYRDDRDKLLAVSILDVCSRSVSSVYHYFDPAQSCRSLGVFSVLAEVDLCRKWSVPHYYMGYWIQGAPTMHYKANYRPHELLIDGRWAPGM